MAAGRAVGAGRLRRDVRVRAEYRRFEGLWGEAGEVRADAMPGRRAGRGLQPAANERRWFRNSFNRYLDGQYFLHFGGVSGHSGSPPAQKNDLLT